MSAKKYQPHQLNSILKSLFKKNSSGILHLTTEVARWQQQRSGILVLQNGGLVYAGTQVPDAQALCRRLGEALKPNLIKAALSVAGEKAVRPNSAHELLTMLVKMRVFTWQEVETLMNTKVLLMIEKFLAYPGEAQWHGNLDLDLGYGSDRHCLNWADIQIELQRRHKIWQSYSPQISSMDAIPVVTNQQLQLVDSPQIKDHFLNSVDGHQSILQIAEKLGRDPLKVAQNYRNWSNNGWMSLVDEPNTARVATEPVIPTSPSSVSAGSEIAASESVQHSTKSHLPTVLSVDDSAIIQTTIKRALQSDYNVLLAGKAEEALNILREVRVELMLLDLTMPDVDGLEFCKTIRAIPQFKDLPIVMVTARDGLVNKMKGHIAGTNKYLTKPFDANELQQVVRQYIK